MYNELEVANLIVFSDTHGNFEHVKDHLSFLTHDLDNYKILFLGDAIDYYFSKYVDDKSDPEGRCHINTIESLLKAVSIPSKRAAEFDSAVESALTGKSFFDLPVGVTRRAVIGAIRSYQTLKLYSSTPNLIFLLGNHEVDLLSGGWYFRSLQKSLLLNLCGVSGVWCWELRDKKKGKNPIWYGNEIKELRDSLLKNGQVQSICILSKFDPILQWLFIQQIMVGLGKFIFMHGGPTISFVKSYNNSNRDIASFLAESRVSSGFNTELFCETFSSGDTIFAPKYCRRHFVHKKRLLNDFLNILDKKILCVGHSPFLKAKYCIKPNLVAKIARVSNQIIKTDAGLKHSNNVGHHYLLLVDGKLRCAKFTGSKMSPVLYNLN
jgi:hypothetical protein